MPLSAAAGPAPWTGPRAGSAQAAQAALDVISQDAGPGTIFCGSFLFTAHDGVDYLVKAFDHGVDDYLCKPPNPQELAARVNAAARVSALQNDLLQTSRHLEQTIKNLEKMALVDELTGAGNERFLMKNLKDHLLEASTRRGGVCLRPPCR